MSVIKSITARQFKDGASVLERFVLIIVPVVSVPFRSFLITESPPLGKQLLTFQFLIVIF